MSSSATVTATFALAALLALASFAPAGVLALAVVLVGALVAAGWPQLLDLPARRSTTALLAAVALAAAAAAALGARTGRLEGTRSTGVLDVLPAVAAMSLLAAFVHQLLRTDGRPRLVESVTGAVTGQAVVVLAAAWVAVPSTYAGPPLAPVVLAAVVTAGAVCATSWPLRVAGPVALVAGAATGWFAATLVVLLGGAGVLSHPRWGLAGLVAGLGAGLLVAAWRAQVARLPAVHALPAALAVAAAPVALAGGGAYLVGRLVLL
ncbi:hypothetical protein [Kineococcus sp. SYSU DK006]|uniref:hypothetical protein n=1 Tax=Kineococcus sp. SYSU DK006 TaxID=3383127 RepID=UPI003D7E0155